MQSMRKFFTVFFFVLPCFLFAQPDSSQHIMTGRKNGAAAQQKPYVILISADGFRHDLADKYQATNLQRLRSSGVAAKCLIPSYPTLTFPNHYTIATGLYPAHHGLVDNTFYDAQKKQVKNWLTLPADVRPHLVTFYMPDVDHEEHAYGPDSKQTGEAVHRIDDAVAKLVRMTDSLQLPVNYIFLSDHGMTTVDTLNFIDLPAAVDTNRFFIPFSEEMLHLYANDKKYIQPAYEALKKQAKDFDVYLPSQTPARWHYSDRDDRYKRVGDILLVPHLPRIFNTRKRRIAPGQHGFDNALPDMQATFYAWGPAFKQELTIEKFENVHVYPLIATILGLKITEKIDGRAEVLKPVLR
jgi:predicted AlkP superfamily pyrophosphatase or phosphodiesterase